MADASVGMESLHNDLWCDHETCSDTNCQCTCHDPYSAADAPAREWESVVATPEPAVYVVANWPATAADIQVFSTYEAAMLACRSGRKYTRKLILDKPVCLTCGKS